MLTQLDNHLLEVASFVVAVNLGTAGIMFKILHSWKKSMDEHKKTVRYVDTCEKMHEALNKLSDERHVEVKHSLDKIESLIRNDGHDKPRIQT